MPSSITMTQISSPVPAKATTASAAASGAASGTADPSADTSASDFSGMLQRANAGFNGSYKLADPALLAARKPDDTDLHTKKDDSQPATADGSLAVDASAASAAMLAMFHAADVKTALPAVQGKADLLSATDGKAVGKAVDKAISQLVSMEDLAASGKKLPVGQDTTAIVGALEKGSGHAAPDSAAKAPDPAWTAAMNAVGQTADSQSNPASLQITTPLSSQSAWAQEFSQKITWMAGQKQQVADMQLNPPSMGPVEVRMTIQNDQASLIFVSASQSVRDSIEHALPRLSEMLASSGISLGNVQVGNQSLARDDGRQQQSAKSSGARAQQGIQPEMSVARMSPATRSGLGLVNTFI